jgi:hypothetical protein
MTLTDTNGLLAVSATGGGVSGAGAKSLSLGGTMSQIATILGALKDTDSSEVSDSIGGKLGCAGDLAWPWHVPIWQIAAERAGARTRRKLARTELFPPRLDDQAAGCFSIAGSAAGSVPEHMNTMRRSVAPRSTARMGMASSGPGPSAAAKVASFASP